MAETPIPPTSKAVGPEVASVISPGGKGDRPEPFEGRSLEIGCCCCNPFKGTVQTLLDKLPDMQFKTIAITGCTTGTGYTLAMMAARQRARIICLNRPSSRSEAALANLKALGADVYHVDCDLMSFKSVRSAAPKIMEIVGSDGLDVLALNAGIMHLPDIVTEDKFDMQMQVNQLSHFLLTKLLWSALNEAANQRGEARVVVHGSAAMNFDGHTGIACACCPHTRGLMPRFFEKHENGGLGGDGCCSSLTMTCCFAGKTMTRYQQSKLANFVYAMALADKINAAGSKVKAAVVHPGVAITNLVTNGLSGGKGGNKDAGAKNYIPEFVVPIITNVLMQSTEMGTMPIATASMVSDVQNGDYYGPGYPCWPITFWGPARKRTPEHICVNWHTQKQKDIVWAKCEEAIGESFTITAGGEGGAPAVALADVPEAKPTAAMERA